VPKIAQAFQKKQIKKNQNPNSATLPIQNRRQALAKQTAPNPIQVQTKGLAKSQVSNRICVLG
jgi:hypothetical protein